MTETSLAGRCTCGTIHYLLGDSPLYVHCCHCRWCQRETGSAFAVNALIETGLLEVTAGMPEAVDTPSASGRGQRIVRCPECRVAIWSHYAGAGTRVAFVRVGTLDEPHRAPPDIHIYTESKQPWVILPAAIPAVAAYYRRSEHWPERSRARWAGLME